VSVAIGGARLHGATEVAGTNAVYALFIARYLPSSRKTILYWCRPLHVSSVFLEEKLRS
jgi:hypothetical protein